MDKWSSLPRLAAFCILGAVIGHTNAWAQSKNSCGVASLRIDIDGDKKLDCVDVPNALPGNEVELRVFLSSINGWVTLTRFVHSDEILQKLQLDSYRNAKFPGQKKGWAVRLIFPEKSSAIYYFDHSSKKMIEFWESD